MKKKLYYTVDHGIDDSEGYKTISVYDIQNNEPIEILNFECLVEDTSKNEILDRLDSDLYPEVDLRIL